MDSDTGVVARIFDAQGNTNDEFLVNDSLPGAQRDVAIISLSNNRFVVGWVDQGVNAFDVKAKVFDAGDPTSGTEFTINSTTANRQNGLDLAALPNGNFVAMWQADGGQDGAGRGVFARMFDSNGTGITAEFQVNQTPIIINGTVAFCRWLTVGFWQSINPRLPIATGLGYW